MSLTLARNLAYTSVSLCLSLSMLIIKHTVHPVTIMSRMGTQKNACTPTSTAICWFEVMLRTEYV